jgi:hypothetical protein
MMMAVVAAIGAALPPCAGAQVAFDSARIVDLQGRVSVERSGELWVLMAGQTVSAGQAVVTGLDGYVQLELSDHSTVEVFANARFIFRANRFSLRDLLDLYIGKVRLHIQHLTDDAPPYRVTSPTAVISVRGTVFEVEVDPNQETTVHVETGSVGVRHRLLGGEEVVVESGQSLHVIANVPLAAAKGTAPLVIVGRIVRAVGESIARVQNVGARTSGSSSGSPVPAGGPSGGETASSGGAPTSGVPTTTASGPSVGDAGSNEPAPAPAPGEDNTGAPPGDVIRP